MRIKFSLLLRHVKVIITGLCGQTIDLVPSSEWALMLDRLTSTFFNTHPRPLFVYCRRCLKTNITIFTTNQCEQCPSSKRYWDSNPLPLDMSLLP